MHLINISSNPPLQAPATDALLERFIAAQDVGPASRALYRRTLKLFFEWVRRNSLDISEISRPHVLAYKADLLDSGKSTLTVASYITAVRKFYEWTEANRYYPNVAKGIKSPRRRQQFRKQPLSPDQARELIDYFADKPLRNFAIINLLLRTGLRTIEIVRANVGDIAHKGYSRVLMVHGKGRDEKDNFVILTEKAYNPIREYISERGNPPNDAPLFVSESNNSRDRRLTTRSISHIAKEGLRAIGLDDRSFSAHSLRHTTAVNILRAGGSLETAQYTLRHTNPATTQIYTATIREEMRLANSGEALLDTVY
ncbi:MAG: tyrosine-type recombinase/integrase [Candidatus Kapaibacterium sp.]